MLPFMNLAGEEMLGFLFRFDISIFSEIIHNWLKGYYQEITKQYQAVFILGNVMVLDFNAGILHIWSKQHSFLG